MVGVTIVVRAELSVRTFGRGGRAFAPEFRSASRPRHRGFDPARPGTQREPRSVTPGTAVGAPGFRPKPRSSTGICDRNFGPRTAISAEIAVGRGRNSGCVERLGTRCMSAHAAGMGLRRMSTA